ncbi:LysR family transcriptional regulator [Xylophilus sp.]|uniref:LysR family transcriptional regulator n=1 Tax=Xylophilus sp. TaxID=2653893 RepID=UPI0013BAB391|nr:LysR family transcriptional regulator [Xylophilus sp.]KAF1042065.1 MAG: Glycine cleavage system transcriptional activator [Xylophilus sp.]
MSKLLPSLIALRSFEAAGRLQSFFHAAAELNVMQGAVSRQIRVLEDELGVKLFNRLVRRVELTDDARAYLREVEAAFRQIEAATSWLRSHQQHHVLNISVLPSVGACWLMPRLASFSQRYPRIQTRIQSSIEPAELHGHAVDVAIRVGPRPGQSYDKQRPAISLVMTHDWRGVLAEELAPDVLVPVYLILPLIYGHLSKRHWPARTALG